MGLRKQQCMLLFITAKQTGHLLDGFLQQGERFYNGV